MPFLGLAWLFLVTVVHVGLTWNWSYDDPYITYRYAENLAAGSGFVYNVGQHVLSTTSPLFSLLLMPVEFVHGNTPRISNLIGLCSIAIGALGLSRIVQGGSNRYLAGVSLILYPTMPLLLNTLGSEMPLYLGFCIFAMLFFLQKRFFASALFCCLATLTRPDGVLLIVCFACWWLVEGRNSLKQVELWQKITMPIAVYIFLMAAWCLFGFLYYGSPIPTTMTAKIAQASIEGGLRFLPGLITNAQKYLPEVSWLEFGFACAGLVSMRYWSRSLVLIVCWTCVYVFAYSLLGVSAYFWYYAPLVPALVVVAAIGIDRVSTHLVIWVSRFTPKHAINSPNRMLLIGTVVCVITVGQAVRVAQVSAKGDPRILIYRNAGEWLFQNTPLDSSIAALEVGAIGYYSRRTMIDFAGLLYPDIARHLSDAGSYEQSAIWTLMKYRPDYLVLRLTDFQAVWLGYAKEYCKPVHTVTDPGNHSDNELTIFACEKTT